MTTTGSDGLSIGAGDLIQTRKNDSDLGVANRQQKGLFYGLVGIAMILFVVGGILIFTK